MPAPQFSIKHAADGRYYFTLLAANSEVLLTSQLYIARGSALNAIVSVRDNAPLEERYERLRSKNEQFYFVLRAANGAVIGTSELYPTRAARENGVDAVKRVAADARVTE